MQRVAVGSRVRIVWPSTHDGLTGVVTATHRTNDTLYVQSDRELQRSHRVDGIDIYKPDEVVRPKPGDHDGPVDARSRARQHAQEERLARADERKHGREGSVTCQGPETPSSRGRPSGWEN